MNATSAHRLLLRYRALLVFLPLLAIQAHAQDTRFFWGPELFPNLSAPRLITYGNLSQDELEARQAFEIGKPAYALGLQTGWTGEKLGFRLGLRFAESGYRTQREPFPDDLPNPEGAIERRQIFTQYRIDLPANIDFSHQLDASNRFFFSLGVAGALHLGQRETEVLYFGDTNRKNGVEEPADNYRPLNAAFTTSMGWEIFLNEDLSLSLAPSFQFWLSPLLQDGLLNRSLYEVGLSAGLRFYRP